MDFFNKLGSKISSGANVVASKTKEFAETTKIGENVYYNLYTSQLENKLSDSSTKNRITFKEGDRFSVTVKNTNTTIAQIIRNFLYRIAGNDTYQIAAQHGGIVTVNGTK